MSYAPSCTPSVQAANKPFPPPLSFYQLSPHLHQHTPAVRVLHHHIPPGLPGHATNTNPTPCYKHIISYSLFSFPSKTLSETSQLHAAMLLAIPFPLGNSALCCPSPLFTPGFPNSIKGLAGQTEFSLNFPVKRERKHLDF